MHILEQWCIAFRHSPLLQQADWLWDRARPMYEKIVALYGQHGLERTINGTDRILVLPQFRGVTETYEPEVWNHLMAQVQDGDIVVDIGAFIGLYTIALAKRVGPFGRVVSFEPDPENFPALKAHVELNCISDRVELIHGAVGIQDGAVPFEVGKASESHISHIPVNGAQMIRCMRLDTMFADRHMDILKIDVEGYEEWVLQGGASLLSDNRRSPRLMYIEVHPYAWAGLGTTSDSLLSLLAKCSYRVLQLDGQIVKHIDSWGEVVAHKER